MRIIKTTFITNIGLLTNFFQTKALYSVSDVFYMFCLTFLTDVLLNDSRTIPNCSQQIKSNN